MPDPRRPTLRAIRGGRDRPPEPPRPPRPPAEQGFTVRWGEIVCGVLAVFFVLRLVWLAAVIDPAIPPDELTHVGRIQLWAASPWGPASGPGNWHLGLVEQRPWLYDAGLGWLLAWSPLPLPDLLLLRLTNIAMAFGTVAFGWRFVRELSDDDAVHVLFVGMLTNTLMFTGIGASVSHDNLANLCAAASIFHAFRVARRGAGGDALAMAAWLLAGCLAKASLLPLAALLVLGLLVVRRAPLLAAWTDAVRRPAALLVALLAVPVVGLYGGNLLAHGRPVPGLEQVVGPEAAMENRIFARDRILADYRAGRSDFREALARADAIERAGDRASTRALLRNTRSYLAQPAGPLRFLAVWSRSMLERATGYFGHRQLLPSPGRRALYAAVLLLAPLAFFAFPRAAPRRAALGAAGALALAYGLVLLLGVNLPSFLATGLPGHGVQGRYLFPVLVPLYAFVAGSLLAPLPAVPRIGAAVAGVAFFVYGDFLFFMLSAGTDWYGT